MNLSVGSKAWFRLQQDLTDLVHGFECRAYDVDYKEMDKTLILLVRWNLQCHMEQRPVTPIMCVNETSKGTLKAPPKWLEFYPFRIIIRSI